MNALVTLTRPFALLAGWWRRYRKPLPLPPEPPPFDPIRDIIEKPDARQWRRPRSRTFVAPPPEKEEGEFYFRGSILDQLDNYFAILKRMKRADRDSYEIYSRIGVNLIPISVRDLLLTEPLSPWWKTHRPGIGAVTYSNLAETVAYEKDQKCWLPKLLYFIKYDRKDGPLEFAMSPYPGDLYKCTVYFDVHSRRTRGPRGVPQEFGVILTPDNDIQILQIQLGGFWVKPKQGQSFYVNSRHWGLPDEYHRYAKAAGISAEQYLGAIFVNALNSYEISQHSMIRVDVSKDRLHAAFGVSVTRTPYFFKDRDVTVNVDGVKQRIFHIVRGHVRADGTKVKTHFRGEREFSWKGYQVKITVPVRDHTPVENFDLFTHDGDAIRWKPARHYLGSQYIGMLIRAGLDRKLRDLKLPDGRMIGTLPPTPDEEAHP